MPFCWFCRAVNHTDFEAFYFLKLPDKTMVFMYPCLRLVCHTQTSSGTHLYLSRRSTRDELRRQCSYNVLVGPRGEVRVYL